jgi:ABC-type lipoprotein export system ATPase subunit
VTGLFGLYNHHVTLKDDRVTVIHGPNGVGKTVFLKLTNAFLRGHYHEIARVPFESFEVLFRNGSVARIFWEVQPKRMHLSFEGQGSNVEKSTVEGEALSVENLARQIAEETPFISQIGPEEWVDRRTDEVLTADDVISRGADFSPQVNKKNLVREPKGLRALRSHINVHLIEAQRLIRVPNVHREWRYNDRPERQSMNTVQEYSRDLKRRIETALATYAKHSQKLDQSFPQRLLEGIIAPLTIDQLKSEMREVEDTRARLHRIGILEGGAPQELYPLQISQLDALQPGQVPVMTVYARDTKEKLAVLEELSGRIQILLDVLNRKFTNKRVAISRESGLAIYGKDDKPIPVNSLSSGEQHELVLLYDLLFKVNPNTLVLIDEPELSLHISWQKGFMDDLLEIIRLAHFDALIATHSPYIVGDHSQLLVVLSPTPQE